MITPFTSPISSRVPPTTPITLAMRRGTWRVMKRVNAPTIILARRPSTITSPATNSVPNATPSTRLAPTGCMCINSRTMFSQYWPRHNAMAKTIAKKASTAWRTRPCPVLRSTGSSMYFHNQCSSTPRP